VLAIASVLLAWGLHALLQSAQFEPPWWLDTPTVLGFYGILWKVYDRQAWRWRWKSLRISDVPDSAGEWNGQLQSSYNGETLDATLTIRQTATHVLAELETENSRSTSVMATLNCRPGPFQGFSFVYENRPRALNAPGMAPHSGRAHLRLTADGRVLEGDYETDHHRSSSGRIKLVRQ
jgi:hypothetical protein